MMFGTKLILHVVISGLEGLRASAQNLLVFKKKKKAIYKDIVTNIRSSQEYLSHLIE